jgi:hypothetical protein
MRPKAKAQSEEAEKAVRDIRRATRFSYGGGGQAAITHDTVFPHSQTPRSRSPGKAQGNTLFLAHFAANQFAGIIVVLDDVDVAALLRVAFHDR